MIQPPSPARGQGRSGTTARVNQTTEFEVGPGLCMITDVVKLRRLTRNLIALYRRPCCRVSTSNKRVIWKNCPLSDVFWGKKACQILTNLTISCQNHAPNASGRRFPSAPGIAKKARSESTVDPSSWQIWPRRDEGGVLSSGGFWES